MWHSELTTALETGCQPAAIVHCGLNYASCVVVQATTVYDLTHVVGIVWYAILKFPVFSADCGQPHSFAMHFNSHIQTNYLQAHSPREKGITSVDTQIGHVATTYAALCPGSKAPQQWDVNIAYLWRWKVWYPSHVWHNRQWKCHNKNVYIQHLVHMILIFTTLYFS